LNMDDDIQFLIIATPMPVAYFTKSMLEAGSKQIDDMEGMWGMKPTEQANFFELISCWKHRKPNREIVVVAGDVHHGVKSAIYKDKQTVFYQLVTSAVGNFALPGFAGAGATAALGVFHGLADDWSFGHQSFLTDVQNYGIITLTEGTSKNGIALQNYVTDGNKGSKEGKHPVLSNECKKEGSACEYRSDWKGARMPTISECCHGMWCDKEKAVCKAVPGLESRQCPGMIHGVETDADAEKPTTCGGMWSVMTGCRTSAAGRAMPALLAFLAVIA